jgi:hypothetical protein
MAETKAAGMPNSRYVPGWTDEAPRAHRVDSIDWRAVAAAYKALDWTWAGEGVPSADSIARTARGLLWDAARAGLYHATGGMKVYPGGAIDFHPHIEAELKRIATENA